MCLNTCECTAHSYTCVQKCILHLGYKSKFVYIYIFIHPSACTYGYWLIHICVYKIHTACSISIYVYVHMYVYTHMSACTHGSYVHVYTKYRLYTGYKAKFGYVHICMFIHVFIHLCTRLIHAGMYKNTDCVCIYMYTRAHKHLHVCVDSLCACVSVCVCLKYTLENQSFCYTRKLRAIAGISQSANCRQQRCSR